MKTKYQSAGLGHMRFPCSTCGRIVWKNQDEAKREAKRIRARYGIRTVAEKCRGARAANGWDWDWGCGWHVGVKGSKNNP